jgi:DNA-binding helix-hairpin-helix protein with protein kinase domain
MAVQTKAKLTFIDESGRPIRLGHELGKGGEGAVFELQDQPGLAAKLYFDPGIARKRGPKITAMAAASNDRLRNWTAWPAQPIRVAQSGGYAAGFTMPLISDRKPAFNLYLPKLRLREFPNASWPLLIRAARNTARAFAIVHESGHVIGDVNFGNILVGANATVRLIDCDSYQITANGTRWFCEVGTPEYQPPEIQGMTSYEGFTRIPNHDNFGLAVVIFQMLFMALHPFSGRYLGGSEMPMERAIKEHRFAYGSRAAAMQMQPPPASPGLEILTRQTALLFERAFSPQGSQPDGRPRAREWDAGLEELEKHLQVCRANPTHHFAVSVTECPWCRWESVTGFPLFYVTQTTALAAGGFDIGSFWTRVCAVPNPGPPPPLPRAEDQRVSLSPAAVELQQASTGAKLASTLLLLVGRSGRVRTLRKEIEQKAAAARSRWMAIQESWSRITNADFNSLMGTIVGLKDQYDSLPQKRLNMLRDLEADRYRNQLRSYLGRCLLVRAHIKGIGSAKRATLQSYGIETALDVVDHRVLAVPGFGPKLLGRLKAWRNQQQRRFVFDPKKGVDQDAKNDVEHKIILERADLQRRLNEALAKLIATNQSIAAQRRTLLVQAEQAVRDLAQAEADFRVL